MKVFVILLVLFTVSFLSVNLAHGIWLPQSPEELLEESQVIVVGNITAVNELELEQPFSSEFSLLILDKYTITVEEFVKNPQGTDTITVRQPTISTPGRLVPHGGFEIGDRVLLYIESFDGTNTFSKESFLIPKQCDTSFVIHEPRIIGSDFTMIQNGVEKKDNFTANTPIQFIAKSDTGTLSGDSPSIKYDAFISKQVGKIYKERVFHQTVTADAKPCQWLSVAEWEFTPDVGNYLLNGDVYKEKSTYSISNTFFSVLPKSPIKQFKSGISFDEIQCKENLVLVQKYDGSPACVTESTKQKLIERGWAENNIQNIKQDFFSKYGIDYDGLVVRNADASVYKTVRNHPNQNCFDLNENMLNRFPAEFLQDLKSATEEEFHNSPQVYPPGVYSGYAMHIDKYSALDFVKKYNFNATKQVFTDNIETIPDEQYRFDCFFDYYGKQYMLRLEFKQQFYDGNFVNVNVTRNDQGIPIILNNDITVFYGGFNSTVLFHNDLDENVILYSDDPIVNSIDADDGDIHENRFVKTLDEFETVIPSGKFFSYYFSPYDDKFDEPISYAVKPFNLHGSITVKPYPRCMTESEVISLYGTVKAHPKFPKYLPEGYSFECGVHNTNAFVHFVYFTDEQRSQFDDKINSAFNREFFADGGLVIDYYDEAWNGWNEDPNYDKHEKANENAAHPWAETYTISGEPAVMIKEYFWQSGEQRSFNRLEVFFDEDQVRISSSLPKSELIKIAESLEVRK